MPELMTQVVLDAVGAIATGGRILIAGWCDPWLGSELRGRGWSVTEVEPSTGTDVAAATRPIRGPEDGLFDVVVVETAADATEPSEVVQSLTRMSQLSSDAIITVLSLSPVEGSVPGQPVDEWMTWEERLIRSGLRRHPFAPRIRALEQFRTSADGFAFVMQVLPADAVACLKADSSFADAARSDLLRGNDLEFEAARMRYDLVARCLKPGDHVVDVTGAGGGGPALLWDLSEVRRVTAVVRESTQRAYAEAMYQQGRDGLEFTGSEPAWLDNPRVGVVDALVCDDLRASGRECEALARLATRVLKPGGRLFLALRGAGNKSASGAPLSGALFFKHCVEACEAHFLIEQVWSSTGATGQGEPRVRSVSWPLSEGDLETEARWRVIVAMRDPVAHSKEPYSETVFPASAAGVTPAPIAFARDYQNPWLVHGMMMGPYRARSRKVLADMAARARALAAPESADAGAALCVALYQLLDAPASTDLASGELVAVANAYIAQPPGNAHAARWRISLQFVLALLAQKQGRPDDAEQMFRACAPMDFAAFSPHLATKCSEACFHAGRLAWLRGDLTQAEADWRAVFGLVGRIPWSDADALLVNPHRPAAFEFGDGMREIAITVDNAARCANGLRMIAYRRSGRVVHGLEWDRSFQTIQRTLLDEVGRRGGEVEALRHQASLLRGELEALEVVRAQTAADLNHVSNLLRVALEDPGRAGARTQRLKSELVTWRRLYRQPMKNVVIFGAGDGGRRVWEAVCLSARASVVCFVDNDPRKQGMPFLGCEVRAPDALQDGGFDHVLVASIHATEIVEQIVSMGVARERVITLELSSGDDVLEDALATAFPVPCLPAGPADARRTRVGLFGTGQGGMRVWEAVMALDHIVPAWFADNDLRKHGQQFLWLDVIAPAEIPLRKVDFVIIASMHREPITKQLIELGVSPDRILAPPVAISAGAVLAALVDALPAGKGGA